MSAFSRPIVALSLTEPDEGLLHYTARLAELLAWTDVHFVHVVAPDSRHDWDPHLEEEKMRAEVDRLFGKPLPNCRPTFHTAQGSRLDQIIKLVVEHERDLVLLSHRRMRSGRRSLARRMAMVAPASVWLVPEGSPAEVSRLLVPIDFSSHSADSLSVAVEIARAGDLGQLHALHVFFDPSSIRFDEHVDEILGKEEEAFQRFVAGVDTRGIHVEPLFDESPRPPEAILRVATRCQSNLIVMNTRGRSQAACVLLGSTTSDTMAATSVPLLAVKHFGSRLTLLEALMNHRLWEGKAPKTN